MQIARSQSRAYLRRHLYGESAKLVDFQAYLNGDWRIAIRYSSKSYGVSSREREREKRKADVDHVRSMGSRTLSAGRSTQPRFFFTRGSTYRGISGDARYIRGETSETDNSVD